MTCSKSSLLERQPLVIVLSVVAVESFLVLLALAFPSASLLPLELLSTVAAAAYRVLQAVLFMDGAYNVNDQLYAHAATDSEA